MKHLLLIRHGLPHEGHAKHPGDPPLHADGRRHAQRLARRLAREGIDRIVSSPQRRALDTAAPLARRLGLAVEVIEGLAEVDRHVARYRSPATIRAEEPHRWAEFVASPARFLGRDPAAYRAGVLAAVEALLAEPRGTRVAVFSHGMTIKTVLYAALGTSDGGSGRFLLDHCSVTRLAGDALDALRVDSVNESLCAPVAAIRTPR